MGGMMVVRRRIEKYQLKQTHKKRNGGEGGIRTHGTLSRTAVFKTAALNHSATSPKHPNRYYMSSVAAWSPFPSSCKESQGSVFNSLLKVAIFVWTAFWKEHLCYVPGRVVQG
jgi:hypothetical protein